MLIKSICSILFFVFVTNAQAFNLAHPIKSLEKDLFFLGVSAITLRIASEYLITHPDSMSHWFSTHPDEIEPLKLYVEHKIENAKNEKEYETYSNLKEQLYLNNDVILELETNRDCLSIKKEVEYEVARIDTAILNSGKPRQRCDINVVASLLLPEEQFHTNINPLLPNILSTPASVLDVDTFKTLDRNYKNYKVKANLPKLTPDHVPSYAAIATYLKDHGLNVPINRSRSDLEYNTAAISIPFEVHKLYSRTYAGRNNSKIDGETIIKNDSKNLLAATIKDITTIAYGLTLNNQYGITKDEYIKSAMTLYARNKLICMYDVK